MKLKQTQQSNILIDAREALSEGGLQRQHMQNQYTVQMSQLAAELHSQSAQPQAVEQE